MDLKVHAYETNNRYGGGTVNVVVETDSDSVAYETSFSNVYNAAVRALLDSHRSSALSTITSESHMSTRVLSPGQQERLKQIEKEIAALSQESTAITSSVRR